MPIGCGRAPVGLSRETSVCNVGVPCTVDRDCRFGPWSHWSACTQSCEGVKERTRRIAQQAMGRGVHCYGGTSQVAPCVPGLYGKLPEGCDVAGERIDCTVSLWSPWSVCSQTCGIGQHQRVRSVKNEPRRGGRPCIDALSEVKACDMRKKCHTVAVACKWGHWSQWSACSECGGERDRTRRIAVHAKDGGKPCEFGNSREAEPCNPTDLGCTNPLYCTWKDWGHWGFCSSTCGNGHRMRRRELMTTRVKPAIRVNPHLQLVEASMQVPAEMVDAGPLKLALAFGAGLSSFLVLMLLFRVLKPFVRTGQRTRESNPVWHRLDNRRPFSADSHDTFDRDPNSEGM